MPYSQDSLVTLKASGTYAQKISEEPLTHIKSPGQMDAYTEKLHPSALPSTIIFTNIFSGAVLYWPSVLLSSATNHNEGKWGTRGQQ